MPRTRTCSSTAPPPTLHSANTQGPADITRVERNKGGVATRGLVVITLYGDGLGEDLDGDAARDRAGQLLAIATRYDEIVAQA